MCVWISKGEFRQSAFRTCKVESCRISGKVIIIKLIKKRKRNNEEEE